MNKEVKIKVFNRMKELPDLNKLISLDTFENLFHFYTEITDLPPSSMITTLKGITRLPGEIIDKIIELIDQEFKLLVPEIKDEPVIQKELCREKESAIKGKLIVAQKIEKNQVIEENNELKELEIKKANELKELKAKEKQRQRQVKYLSIKRDSDPLFDLRRRIDSFTRKGAGPKTNITTEQFFEKFGKNPVCYLTGQPINLGDLKSFAFDHIVPRCQGGSNELSNMGLCSPMANTCKSGYSLEQFIALCKQISSFHS